MRNGTAAMGLETKYHAFGDTLGLRGEGELSGYASVFGIADQGGDVVSPGAYAASLRALSAAGSTVKMLWQHDAGEPIGVWDEIREDARGLFVRGRLLPEVRRGAEALALIRAGAIEGLSIGYRTVRSERTGRGRLLHEIELWEVSLVTFPMLPEARAGVVPAAAETEEEALIGVMSAALAAARRDFS